MTQPIDLGNIKNRLLVADYLKIDADDIPALQRFIANKSRLPPPELTDKIQAVASGYPLDYALSETIIGGFSLHIPEGVFIPRPETEHWLNQVFSQYPSYFAQADTIVDLCSGIGLISLITAKKYPHTSVIGLDYSLLAIKTAIANAAKNNIINVKYIESKWLTNLPKLMSKSWVLLCNPPYVPVEYEFSVQHEPSGAIYSGVDGLDFFRQCINELVQLSQPPALSVFELDPRNIDNAADIVGQIFPQARYTTLTDQNGHKRALVIEHA